MVTGGRLSKRQLWTTEVVREVKTSRGRFSCKKLVPCGDSIVGISGGSSSSKTGSLIFASSPLPERFHPSATDKKSSLGPESLAHFFSSPPELHEQLDRRDNALAPPFCFAFPPAPRSFTPRGMDGVAGRVYMGPVVPVSVGGDIRVPLIKADRCLKRSVSAKKGPKWCSWCGATVLRALRLRCCVVPTPRHRLLALVLLATGAYCVLVHPQLLHQAPPLPLAFVHSHGNRTRNLAAVRDNLSSASNHRVSDDASDVRHHPLSLFAGAAGRGGEVEEEMARRRKLVWEVCRTSGLVADDGTSKVEPNAWEFFVDEHHHLVWCNIFKAASSSWMYNFNLLGDSLVTPPPSSRRKGGKPRSELWTNFLKMFGGYKEQYLRRSRKSPLALARERFPRPSVDQLKAALPHSLSFLIVRDPFERLLSAYRNKIEGFRHKFYRKMAREMISKFRFKTSPAPGTHRSLNNEKSPTFSEFVSWVIESANNAKGVKDGGYSGIPGFDEHWAPYYRFCTPCAVNFSVVAKMETLARDEAYIIEKSGIGGALGRKAGALDMSNRPREAVNAAIGARTEDVLPRYFETLNKEQIDSLYDIYKIDFLMFGYDVSKYYNMLPS